MTESEIAGFALTALETLREAEAEILRDIERLEVRLEITRETIALLKGEPVRQRKPEGKRGRKADKPPNEPFIPEFEPEPAAP